MRNAARARAPWLALTFLTGVNLLNYIDRYIFSALLPAIKNDLKFSDTELGILGSAFLLAYTFASPVFGVLGDRQGRSKIMAAGAGLWSVATAFSGVCTTFVGQLGTRALVGLGESAYTVIAPSTISDYFSRKSRGRVFAIYSGAIPVGSALGYVIGGKLEPILGWHRTFWVVGGPGLVLAALLFFLPDPPRGAADSDAETGAKEAPSSIGRIYRRLSMNGGYMSTVLGYAAYTFVVGGMAFWMPSYLVRYFSVSLEEANVKFGTLTVAGGFIGTLVGGWWSDWIERRSGNGYLKVSVISMVLAVPLFVYALSLKDYNQFMTALFVLEIAIFLCISPMDAAVISYVRPVWRASAMALTVFIIHVLGDGVSRTLMGIVSDSSGLQTSIELLPWALALAGVLWLAGWIFYWQAAHWPAGALNVARWQAHRGYRAGSGVVENTLEAFRNAKLAGAEMFECDVRPTKDGEIVVFHDGDLKRLAGRPERVAGLSAADMKSIANAPRLSELLADPGVPSLINIELKSIERGDTPAGGEKAFAANVVRLVREARAQGRVIFSSFDPLLLGRLARLAPEIPRALIATERDEPGNSMLLRNLWLGFYARPHLLHLDGEMVSPRRLQAWADRGLKVAVWTINDPARARALLSAGAVSVISDRLVSESSASA